MRLTRTAALVVLLGVATAGALRAQWNLERDPREWDLLVEGTLVDVRPSLVAAHGATYDQLRGTIRVERVVYAEVGVEVGDAVELYSAQEHGVICPRVDHAAFAFQRGVWCLRASSVPGVFTSYDPGGAGGLPLPSAPGVRVASAAWAAPGVLDLELRYESQGPIESWLQEVTVDARGRLRGAPQGLQLAWFAAGELHRRALPASDEPAPARVHVPAGRWTRRHVRVPVPPDLPRDDLLVGLAPTGCAWVARPVERSDDAPVFLEPGEPTTTLVALPPAGWVVAALALGLLPFTTRGRTWRWTGLARAAGGALALVALALLPWCLLGWGLPLRGGDLLTLETLGVETLLLALVAWRWPAQRTACVVAGLVPPAWALVAPLVVR